MSTGQSNNERRRSHRVDGRQLEVSLRPRGRLAALRVDAVDFSRHGMAVHTHQALDKDRTVYLSLRLGEIRVDHLVGVVHNCVRRDGHFRSGIRFRPTSDLQHDRRRVEMLLGCLEDSLLDRRSSA